MKKRKYKFRKKKKENRYETPLYIVGGVIAAILINFLLSVVLATAVPIVAVESNSMVPAFSKGDILIIQGSKTPDLKIGDVIVFSVSGQPAPIVHRIVSLNSDGTVQTKGDANNGQLPFETSIQGSQILGKSILIIPYLGWVKLGLVEFIMPNFLLIAIILLTIAFIYLLILRE